MTEFSCSSAINIHIYIYILINIKILLPILYAASMNEVIIVKYVAGT